MKTAENRSADGEASTVGDVGHVDDEGWLYLTDRKSYMIISGGVNIYPQETENLLSTHPAVLDVAVIGVPNDDLGEEVKAVVQPVDPARAGPELAHELIASAGPIWPTSSALVPSTSSTSCLACRLASCTSGWSAKVLGRPPDHHPLTAAGRRPGRRRRGIGPAGIEPTYSGGMATQGARPASGPG